MLVFSICRNSGAPNSAASAKISEQGLSHGSIYHNFTVLQKDLGVPWRFQSKDLPTCKQRFCKGVQSCRSTVACSGARGTTAWNKHLLFHTALSLCGFHRSSRMSPKENKSRWYTCIENYISCGREVHKSIPLPSLPCPPSDLQISYQQQRGRIFTKGMGGQRVLV